MKAKNSIVDDHRNMLSLSKNLSDFQKENLKTWPFIFFSNVDEAKVEWNFIDNSHNFFAGSVTFDIKLKEEVSGEEFQLGVDRLAISTKMLFWSETEVFVNKDGKEWKKV